MSIQHTIDYREGILHVVARGVDESLDEVMAYGQAVFEAAIEHDCRRVLCDEREVEYRISSVDTFYLAEHWARLIPGSAWLAIVCRPENLDDLAFFEMVAVNRGIEVKACRTLGEAERWLQESFDMTDPAAE